MSVCVCVPYCETVCSFLSYEDPEVALTCGVMLRECVKHEPLAKLVLDSPEFFTFFRYVEVSTFDIASDAFSTFKVLGFLLFISHTLFCRSCSRDTSCSVLDFLMQTMTK